MRFAYLLEQQPRDGLRLGRERGLASIGTSVSGSEGVTGTKGPNISG